MHSPEETKRIQEWGQMELARLTKTVDDLVAPSPNSYSKEGAYVGALVQTLALIEQSAKR